MNDDSLDREIREALEPDAGAVDRVVRGALRQDRRHRSIDGRLIVTLGAIGALVAGVLLMNRETPVNAPVTTSMTNIDDTIVVRPASGGVWLIGGSGEGAGRLPAGAIVVHKSGESQ